MIINKKKFRNGIKQIAIAIGLAFTGPIIFVLSGNTIDLINILGLTLMIFSVLTGILGVKNLLSGFFEKPNE